LRINSAILTGNKIEPGFQAGWVNTIRFLESWTGATLTYRGSFICLWASSSPGLITDPNTQIVGSNYWYTSAIGNWHYVGFQSGPGYYAPPVRDWGFDTRFQSLANMPPGTPFLTSGIYSNWTESGR
jgi:hypothetical protein